MISKSQPGQRTGVSPIPRDIMLSYDGLIQVVGQCVIDATYAYDGANTDKEDELRPGTPMAQITASKQWVPCKRSKASVASASASAASAIVTVVDARAFKAGDEITVNATTGLIISSINYSTNVITLTTSIDIDLAVDDPVFASGSALAGAETARCLLNEFVKLKDEDGTWRDKLFTRGVIAGFVDDALILGDLAAIRADTSNRLASILWADRQGM